MIMKLRTRKALITGLAALALLLTAGLYAVAQQGRPGPAPDCGPVRRRPAGHGRVQA